MWHIACKSGRATGGVLVRVFKMKVKTINSPNQLTVVMFYIIITQLRELQIPILVPGKDNETNLVELRLSFLIHYAIFEVFTLLVDP
jgi:hypothetical protein